MADSRTDSRADSVLQDMCVSVLLADTPGEKIRLANEVFESWQRGSLSVDEPGQSDFLTGAPVLPKGLQLATPRDLPKRSFGTLPGRIAQLHALAHIEYNAIHLAFDLVARFANSQMPPQFIDDWLQVGAQEATHFQLLQSRLQALGSDYGAHPAHDGLWQAAEQTRHDLVERLAYVPLVFEARGLDVTPMMIKKFSDQGDPISADILTKIYEDEKGHVTVGMKWFRYFCDQRKLDPVDTFRKTVKRYFRGSLAGPFNEEARQIAGLERVYYADL